MRRWDLQVVLDPDRNVPLFLQLANAIGEGIRGGRLRPGDPLPGTRLLAQQLGINRNTVIATYQELAAEGWTRTRPGGGTFVAELTTSTPAKPVHPEQPGPTYTLGRLGDAPRPRTVPSGVLSLRSLPDARLFPARALARAFRRAIEYRGYAHVSYGEVSGHVRLRTQLAAMLSSTRGLPVTADNVMVTRSIEQGIDLVARILIEPGDAVVVERFGYPPVWRMMQLAGAQLVPLAVDEGGLDVDALEAVLKQQRVRAVFLTPHHQFPTAVVMPAPRRLRLAELARAHRFAIIEDDYDHEFHYEGKPVLPIAAGPGGGNVIYIGSLANLLAPGLGTAFVAAPPAVFEKLTCLRAANDAASDAAMECAIAELFEDGELLRHLRRIRRIYESRRDALVDALNHHLHTAVQFRVPEGGMGLWLRADDSINVPAWIARCEQEGVSFEGGQRYDVLSCEQPYLRLGFTQLDEAQLREAVVRMARALRGTGRPGQRISTLDAQPRSQVARPNNTRGVRRPSE
jgi:GntR family transcriptional regulator / MocR family aminotransferase